MILDKEPLLLLNEPNTIKVLITCSPQGKPNALFNDMMSYDVKTNSIICPEVLRFSESSRNLTYAIWFNKHVWCLIGTSKQKNYFFECMPLRTIISGPLFQRYYNVALERSLELSSVWLLHPCSYIDETISIRLENEKREHPLLQYLDQLNLGRCDGS